jgi:lysophospholipase L1-like esterase
MRNRFAADLFGPRKPRYTHVIVMGGTNDLGVDYIDATRVKNVEDNLAFMYAMAQARGVTVIAVTVPPHSNVSERTEPVNRWIREQGHPFIDLATRMACGAPDILCPEYRKTPDDRVHWSAAGHALVAAELRKIFSDCR